MSFLISLCSLVTVFWLCGDSYSSQLLDCNTPETLTLLTTPGLWWLPLVRRFWWRLESEWWAVARLTDWRILLSAPSADLPAYSFLPQLRRVWSLDDGRVNHGQRAESGQSRAGEQDSHVTVTWPDTVTPLARCDAELAAGCVAWARCVTVRPGLLCHDTGQRKHRTRGHGLQDSQQTLWSSWKLGRSREIQFGFD